MRLLLVTAVSLDHPGTEHSDHAQCAATIALRKEIRDLKDGPERDLLLLAWQSLYERDPTKPNSWYQMSGIHGMPYIKYNDVHWKLPGKENDVTEEELRGYCMHSTQLFPTWHRIYALLIEQV